MYSYAQLKLGVYRIQNFQIRPEPDLAGFIKWIPAGAEAGAGFAILKINELKYFT